MNVDDLELRTPTYFCNRPTCGMPTSCGRAPRRTSTVRVQAQWQTWTQRRLDPQDAVRWWADAPYLKVGLPPEPTALFVELGAFSDGYRRAHEGLSHLGRKVSGSLDREVWFGDIC